jgi:hypothetical protein
MISIRDISYEFLPISLSDLEYARSCILYVVSMRILAIERMQNLSLEYISGECSS